MGAPKNRACHHAQRKERERERLVGPVFPGLLSLSLCPFVYYLRAGGVPILYRGFRCASYVYIRRGRVTFYERGRRGCRIFRSMLDDLRGEGRLSLSLSLSLSVWGVAFYKEREREFFLLRCDFRGYTFVLLKLYTYIRFSVGVGRALPKWRFWSIYTWLFSFWCSEAY